MASGPEILVRSLIKALGVDPALMLEGMQGFVKHVYDKLDEFDKRMTAQETLMREIAEGLRQQKAQSDNVVPLLPHTGTEG